MATILIADDNPVNCEYLETVLRYAGHEVLQAADGAVALELTRRHRPDLVIIDLQMPSMGGVEFADRVHENPVIAHTPILFYTATYLDAEARLLAASCNVETVLIKPAEPQVILAAVERALAGDAPPKDAPSATAGRADALGLPMPGSMADLVTLQQRLRSALDHAREHGLDSEAAQRDADEIAYAFHLLSLRLTKLLELDLALTAERSSAGVLERFCRLAADIMHSRYAAVGILEPTGKGLQHFAAHGFGGAPPGGYPTFDPHAGLLGEVLAQRIVRRAHAIDGEPQRFGLPEPLPSARSLIVSPLLVRSAWPRAGFVYFADREDGTPYDNEDEQFAVTLTAQLALVLGNLAMFEEVQRHAAKLELEVAERRRAQEELAHRISHDPVTGLPRLVLVMKYLETAIAQAAAAARRIVVLYLDLDRFHLINETRGREAGDHVLRVIASRLRERIEQGFVAQAASDEFVLLWLLEDGGTTPLACAEQVRQWVEEPIDHAEGRIYVTGSVGVSCYPDNGEHAQTLLWEAEAAMRRAKHEGRNTVRAFANAEKQRYEERRAIGAQLRDAIGAWQFVLQYQPQISAQDWRVVGFEALLRWQHPTLGLLGPDRFIAIAEQFGLIVEIGDLVIDRVCAEIRTWLDAQLRDFVVSVNVSTLQVQRPDFVDRVRAALVRHGVPAACLELELTESALAQRIDEVAGTMRALRGLGAKIALDDFGTGYSCLQYLRHFSIDRLKIDQGFVRDITSDASSAGICRAVITLGHQFGVSVMAEGVETAAQVGYLLRNGCDFFQGYYFSRPIDPEPAQALLRHRYLTREILVPRENQQTLLLVDDEENVLRALSRALRRDGYEILTANSAREAFELLARNEVQVIISDQRMPELSGTEFLSRVKEMYPQTVRMVLSGYTDITAVTEAINRGAIYKFLTKPWNDAELRMQIRDAFSVWQSRAATRTTTP
jgi:diguanylate cyclase (GGDEF)-like protein